MSQRVRHILAWLLDQAGLTPPAEQRAKNARITYWESQERAVQSKLYGGRRTIDPAPKAAPAPRGTAGGQTPKKASSRGHHR